VNIPSPQGADGAGRDPRRAQSQDLVTAARLASNLTLAVCNYDMSARLSTGAIGVDGTVIRPYAAGISFDRVRSPFGHRTLEWDVVRAVFGNTNLAEPRRYAPMIASRCFPPGSLGIRPSTWRKDTAASASPRTWKAAPSDSRMVRRPPASTVRGFCRHYGVVSPPPPSPKNNCLQRASD